MQTEPIKIFIAYARKDDEMLTELRKQFVPLELAKKITVWYDGQINPGEKWDEEIQAELNAANIILLLVSPDSISSHYFYESEVQKAIQRHEDGRTKVIPVILRPCLWQETPIGKLQALPENGEPILLWDPIDAGYFDVVKKVNEIINNLLFENISLKEKGEHTKNQGTLIFEDSDRIKVEYEGEIFNGKANGVGKARALGNNPFYEYIGRYSNNLRNDKNAKITWGDGDTYEGEYRNDTRTGKGKYFWDNGDEYIGEFFNNEITGNGILKTEKFHYEGELKGKVFHKFGKLKDFEKKCIFEGEFWEGIKRGKGEIVFENGWSYEGEFFEDKPHGRGKSTQRNGVVHEGQFRKGKLHGQGKASIDQRIIHEGEFRNYSVKTTNLLVNIKGNKLELIDNENNHLGEEVEVILYEVNLFNGDTFIGKDKKKNSENFLNFFSSNNLASFTLRGTYIFENDIRLTVDQNNVKEIFFPSGAKIEKITESFIPIKRDVMGIVEVIDLGEIDEILMYGFLYTGPDGRQFESGFLGNYQIKFPEGVLIIQDSRSEESSM